MLVSTESDSEEHDCAGEMQHVVSSVDREDVQR